MKREKTVSITITEDESKAILLKMQEKERELGKRISISAFLREYAIAPLLNGDGSSPPQETEIETPQKTEKNKWDNLKI
jgi:hypothetical protein